MTPPPLERYADHFERLAGLSPDEREAAIAALTLDGDERAWLRRLLEADADAADDPLAQALAASAGAQLAALEWTGRLGAYRLLRELGAGGMGTVFLAERVDGGFTQRVAIKLLRGFPTSEGLRRLRRERQILSGLEHPNIARLLDGGETADGQPWLAVEYVDGMPVLAHANAHAPRLADRLALFDAILDAVAHAHQRLVVHRDLKPANVLVDSAGTVKLLDFGIAMLLDVDGEVDSATSTRIYSAGYASPEQREGRAITTASDIYSLGVLLGELLAATPQVHLDAELAGILAKARDADPARRYASAGAFRDDLERYRDGRPVHAARMTRRYRLRKFVGRHRSGVAIAFAALLALSLGVWRLGHERNRAIEAEHAASRDADRARAALAFLTDAFEAAAPDNALGASVSVRDLLDHARAQIVARELDASVAQPLQRLLGHLYDELGDPLTGAELLAQGSANAEVHNTAEALALARDHDRHAHLEAINGHHEAALAAAARAAALRERHAPGDADERARNLLVQALILHNHGENTKAIAHLREALAMGTAGHVLDADLEAEISDKLMSMLVFTSECREALGLGDASLARVDTGEIAPSARIEFLRTLATAHTNCVEPARAETLYRTAIAEQEALVGKQGIRMLTLLNDLAVPLSLQGRYREAAALLVEAGALDRGYSARSADYAAVLGNRASVFESAGDYAQALALFAEAVEDMDRVGTPADAEARRRLLRNQARALALAGKEDAAATILLDLRDRAQRLDGAGSIEHLMCTWQLALVERRRGRLASAEAYLREAETGLVDVLPPEHVVFAHALRQHGAIALARGDAGAAAQRFEQALAHMRAGETAAVDVAIARAELASAQLALDRRDAARAELRAALPVLRDVLLPTEVSRVDAERTARALGLP